MGKASQITVIENRFLQIKFDRKEGVFDVLQKKSGTQWKMTRKDKKDLFVNYYGKDELILGLGDASVQKVITGDQFLRARYSGFKGTKSQSLAVEIMLELKGEDLKVVLEVIDSDNRYEFDSLYYPRSFLLDQNDYWILPMQQGRLEPGSFRKEIDARLGHRPTLRCFGAVKGKSGFLCLWDTPYDFYLAQVNDKKEGPRYFPRCMSSLGKWNYNREMTLCFRENFDYVKAIRDVYKPWAMKKGWHKTLKEKMIDTPNIKDLPGSLMIHHLVSYVDRRRLDVRSTTFDKLGDLFNRIINRTGVKKGMYHLDGWCRQGYDALHPDVFPPYEPAGGVKGLQKLSKTVRSKNFHFGLHDNYQLFFPDCESYKDELSVWDKTLHPHRDQFRAGGMNFVLSPACASEFIRKNYITGKNSYRRRWAPAKDLYKMTFCYLDQFLGAGGHNEDFNPAHTLNREQFIKGMLEGIDVMKYEVGCITSSEHMSDFGINHYDVNGNSHGLAPNSPGEGCIPVPLFNLAFHECIVVNSADVDSDYGVKAAMIGGILHHRRQHYTKTFDPYKEDEDLTVHKINLTKPIRNLHEEVCFKECTGSKLISEDGSIQEVDYEGIRVKVDFYANKVTIKGGKKCNGTFSFNEPTQGKQISAG